LNIILYCANNLCKYLVDLDAVSLVSYMATMEGGVDVFISACRPGSAVLSVPQFHDNMLVVGFVCGMLHRFRIGWFCIGLGSVKFGRRCRHFRVSSAIFSGRYGNFCNSISKFGRSAGMNEYISFCILSNGLVVCGFSE
jgi:hypothetical protein